MILELGLERNRSLPERMVSPEIGCGCSIGPFGEVVKLERMKELKLIGAGKGGVRVCV